MVTWKRLNVTFHVHWLSYIFLTVFTINSDRCFEQPNGPTFQRSNGPTVSNVYVLLTVHLSISIDNDQLDTQLLYFTIRPLQSSTCFDHYMFIIRRLNCIDAASGIVLSVSGLSVHSLRVLSQPVHRTASYWKWRYQMPHQYNWASWWLACNARNMLRIVVDVL